MQQQQQQQQGGTQYGVPPPEMAPFASPSAGPRAHMLSFPSGADHQQQHRPPLAEAASPISSRPPASRQNFDELVSAAVPANFADEEALAAGEEVERGGIAGNRWPRQETLALLKIRSDMDAAFRDANLKGPLWEDVSRKLAELGYTRSAKKCKEKFENVHKYYKRTKEGRAGRQDGKNYRFFTQLEALHSGATSSTTPTSNLSPSPISTAMASPSATVPVLPTAPVPTANPTPPPTTTTFGISSTMPGTSSATTRVQLSPVPAPTPTPTVTPPRDLQTPIPAQPFISSSATAAGISFSSDTFSSSESETDDEDGDASRESRKRKRGGGGESGGSGKMMAFFEGLMKQVMERQEAMQQQFLETIEKREQDRMIREEAWKRQEMARLNREHELLAQERAMAATRDAAVISFLQKISGHPIQMPPPVTVRAASPPQPSPPPPSQQQHHPPPSQQQQHPPAQQPQKAPAQSLQPQAQPHQELQLQRQSTEIVRVSSSTELVPVPVPEPHEVVATGAFEGMSSSSRWPKSEVHALIKLRSGLEGRYQEAGPKGPLWEEISQGMQRLGYSRSAKRCKEKWENINKYFKKVKESNKKRPEDAKTCPYFHQLDALYRKKLFGNQRHPEPETNPNSDLQERRTALPPAPQQQSHPETQGNNGNPEGGGSSASVQIQTSNGGPQPSFGTITMKKPEDIVKELMEQQHQQASMDDYDKMDEHESDNIDGDDDDDDGHDDEERTMQYKIQFQGQNVGGGGGNASAKAPSAATAGSFLAMVQ